MLESGARLRDLLRAGDWSVAECGAVTGREEFRRMVGACAGKVAATATPGRLQLFCAHTALDALLAYFVCSELDLFAAVAPPRRIAQLIQRLESDAIGRIFVAQGQRPPPEAPANKVARIGIGKGPEAVRPSGGAGARLVFNTSGSTGVPKLVACEESRLLANARVVASYLGLTPGSRSLCAFPVTLMYGFSTMLCALASGGHVEFVNWSTPELMVEAVRDRGIDVLPLLGDWAIPLSRAWRHAGRKLPRITMLTASDRLLRTQAQHLLSINGKLWNNYGQSESGPRLLAAEIASEAQLERLCSDGVVAPGYPVVARIQLRIGEPGEAAEGEPGRMFYQTPFAMAGYVDARGMICPGPEWIDSGDLFRRTTDGAYHWAGRADHVIKHNGQYVPLHSLLDSLIADERISGAALRKDDRGELHLFVVSEHRREVEELVRTLTGDCLRGLSPRLSFVRMLPFTESGKIDSGALVSRLRSGFADA